MRRRMQPSDTAPVAVCRTVALLSATVRPMRVPHSTAHSAVVSHTRRHHEPACHVPTCEHAAKDAAEADGRGHWPATTTSQHPINHTLPSPGVNSHMLFLRLHCCVSMRLYLTHALRLSVSAASSFPHVSDTSLPPPGLANHPSSQRCRPPNGEGPCWSAPCQVTFREGCLTGGLGIPTKPRY